MRMRLSECLIAICTWLVAIHGYAQSTQQGKVWAYNGKEGKTSLGGTELVVSGAPSTVSAKDGSFKLSFRVLKPGDAVTVRRVEKSGYEIFNKEAVDQWHVSEQTVFNVILCRSDQFHAIRDRYSQLANESYARQHQKDRQRLERELAEGKLTQEQHKAEIVRLEENYQNQLDNIEAYVDKFSRIDLSSLSKEEQQIIDLVQAGDIDGAVAAYEKGSFVQEYSKQAQELSQLKSASEELRQVQEHKIVERDSLFAIISRQIDLYKLAGGEENFKKAEALLKSCADADDTNWRATWDYSYFEADQCSYAESIKYLLKLLDSKNEAVFSVLSKPRLESIIADVYRRAGMFVEADAMMEAAISDQTEYEKTHLESAFDDTGSFLNNRGLIYQEMGEMEKSKLCYIWALGHYWDIYKKEGESIDIISKVAEVEGNLAAVYWKAEKMDSAVYFIEDSYKNFKAAFESDSVEYFLEYVTVENNLGLIYSDAGRENDAEIYLFKARTHLYNAYQKNPRAFGPSLAMTDRNLGCLYLENNILDRAEIFLRSALANYKNLFQNDSVAYVNDYAHSFYNMARLKTEQEDHVSAVQFAKEAYNLLPDELHFGYSEKLMNLGIYFLDNGKKDEGTAYLLAAVQISPQEPCFYETLALGCLRVNEEETARKIWEALKQLDPEYETKYPDSKLNTHFKTNSK